MSWIFGMSGPRSRLSDQLKRFGVKPLYVVAAGNLSLALGGIPETCLCEHDEATSSGWAVVGLGIRYSDHRASFLTKADWKSQLSFQAFDPALLDGHFIILRWDKNSLECFSDQVGFRTLYFTSNNGSLWLSTRLSWTARAAGRNEIDIHHFGSGWLLYNQLTNESPVKGIDRLGPSGHVLFEGTRVIKKSFKPWCAEFGKKGSPSDFSDRLESILRCIFNQGLAVSLGLSGGLDSRVLLELMRRIPSEGGHEAHTFGYPQDPDVRIARGIANAMDLDCQYFHDALPDVSECISSASSFAANMDFVEPVSSFVKLRYFSRIRDKGGLVIDGAFGEVARRQYLNRVVHLGKEALRTKDIPRLCSFMNAVRADIFAPDVKQGMLSGAHRSIHSAVESMPPVEEIGIENFADLFAVRTRLPYYGGPGQARMDEEVVSLMPFGQPSILREMLRLPLTLRRNGVLYRSLIRQGASRLQHFPLVKSGMTYPFASSTLSTWLLTKVKSRIGMKFLDPTADQLLAHMKEYVLDLAHSREVRECPFYEKGKVPLLVDRHYAGERQYTRTVDWWLTFELWRESLHPFGD